MCNLQERSHKERLIKRDNTKVVISNHVDKKLLSERESIKTQLYGFFLIVFVNLNIIVIQVCVKSLSTKYFFILMNRKL